MNRYRRFLHFSGLSGLGWCLDFALFLLLTAGLAVLPAFANLASSLCAAAFVFLVSRRAIFAPGAARPAMRFAAYLGYTLLVVILASQALQLIVGLLGGWQRGDGAAIPPAALPALAKIAITPPQLLLNFCVARLLAERHPGLRHG